MKKLILILLVGLISTSCSKSISQNENSREEKLGKNCGIVYGKNHSFVICAPEGWVLDNSSGVEQGLHAVFYPSGSSWKSSKVVMYANWADKNERLKDIDDLIRLNLFNFKSSGSRNVKAQLHDMIKTENGKKCQIWQYSGDKWGNYELVGYFEEKRGIAIIVMSTKDIQIFETAKNAFYKLVKSYFSLSDDFKHRQK
ncbi:hypothetical protein ACFL2O_08530 [Thermodesulfobacteriota bacterium]